MENTQQFMPFDVSAALRRGQQLLKDREWEDARILFSQILISYPENAEAFVGMMLTKSKCASLGELTQVYPGLYREEKVQILDALTPEEHAAQPGFDGRYPSRVASAAANREQMVQRFDRDNDLRHAMEYGNDNLREGLERIRAAVLSSYDQRIASAARDEEMARREVMERFEEHVRGVARSAARPQQDAQYAGRPQQNAPRQQQNAPWQQQSGQYAPQQQNPQYAAQQAPSAPSPQQDRRQQDRGYEALDIHTVKAPSAAQPQQKAKQKAERKAGKQKKDHGGKNKVLKLVLIFCIAAAALAGLVIGAVKLIPMLSRQSTKKPDLESMSVSEKRTYLRDRQPISAGGTYTVCVTDEGRAKLFGALNGARTDLGGIEDIVMVSAGDDFVVSLNCDGKAFASGRNYDGQCGINGETGFVAVSAGGTHCLGLRKNGTVAAYGNFDSRRCNVTSWKDIVQVAAGGAHSVGLKKDGTVVATGDNTYGQCDVDSWTNIVAISAGDKHTVGLKKDGTVVAVGDKSDSQCRVTDWKDIVQISAGYRHTVGLKADGTVVAVGWNVFKQCECTDWTDIVFVAAGRSNTVGLKKDGTVVAVGNNDYGQLGISEQDDVLQP